MAEGTRAPKDDSRATIDQFTQAVQALTEIAQQLRSAAPLSAHHGPPHLSPPTAEEREGRDAAFRYRLLRSLMTGIDSPGIVVGVERYVDNEEVPQGLKVTLPQGVTATLLSLVGDLEGTTDLVATGGERARREFPLQENQTEDGALGEAGINIRGLLDDIRLFEEPGDPVLAVAPALSPLPPATGTSRQPTSARTPAS